MGDGATLENEVQNRLGSLHDQKEETESQAQLEDLRPPGGCLGLKPNETGIHLVDDPHTQGTAQELVAVLDRTLVVGGIDIGGEVVEADVEQKGNTHDRQRRHEGIHELARSAEAVEQRPQNEDQRQGHHNGYGHVQRGVYTQVHTGEGDEQSHGGTDDPHPFFLAAHGESGVATHGGLGVAAGEGVPRGGFSGRFHDGEVGIQHPRTGDTAGDLQKLIDVDTEKACQQNEVALLFVHAPEHEHARHDEEQLVAELGEDEHEGVQDGISDGFQLV